VGYGYTMRRGDPSPPQAVYGYKYALCEEFSGVSFGFRVCPFWYSYGVSASWIRNFPCVG
jgi:hypothetical protein